jgi:HEAT repeat protein/cyclophilin family peptidyl-prolyl cis-trans isomerase
MLHRTIGQAALILIPCLAALSCAATLQQPAEAPPLDADQLLLRKAEILKAEDLRTPDGSLVSAIEEGNSELRVMAARSMGRIGDQSFRQHLERALSDPEPMVRGEAAFALGLLGDSAALSALGRAAKDPIPAVRARAASALGLLKDPASEGTLIALLGDPVPAVAAAACYALPLFDKPGFAVDPLLTLIDERAADVGMAALRALAWIASDRMLLGFSERQRVRELMIDFTDSHLAEARSLAALGLALPAVTEEAELLGRLAEEDPSPIVRYSAIRSLSFPGAPVEPFVAGALEDDNDLIVLAAAHGLGLMKGSDAVEALANLIVHDERLWLRKLAVELAGRVSPGRAAAMAHGLSRDENPDIRAASARLLYGRTEEQALAIAERLLTDDYLRVRAAAIPALAGAEGKLTEILGEALEENAPLVRIAVADAAGRRLEAPDRSEEERLDAMSIIQSLWRDEAHQADSVVRLAVMDAAVRAGARPEVRTLLDEALGSSDRQLGLRAGAYLKALYGENAAAELDRPLADYVDILRWAENPRAAVITIERPGFIPGNFTIRLDTSAAPLASWQFAQLAESHFYDGQEITNIMPGLLVQSGRDENKRKLFRDEISPGAFDPGTMGLAPSGVGLADSRWFISMVTQPLLSPDHTAFAKVVQNFVGVVGLLLPGDRIVSVEVYEGDGSEAPAQP